jgi:hypothetical protein
MPCRNFAVAPVNSVLGVGATEQFTAYGSYDDGSVQNITSSVTWKASKILVATIASSGLATEVAAGTGCDSDLLGTFQSPAHKGEFTTASYATFCTCFT